ncbi:MAG: DNA polymerase/3'-5' exonuclease PolX [Actinomycetota bacterium]
MATSNAEVAAALHELADLLELDGSDRFRPLAYRRAGDAVRGLGREVAALTEAELVGIHGIGKATAARVRELLDTGSIASLEALRRRFPPGVLQMTRLSGLGAKKALALHQALGVHNLDELKEAILAGRLAEVAGFGAKTGENLLRAIERHTPEEQRVPVVEAMALAEDLLALLRSFPEVEWATCAGSLRRMRETIGDLDLLAATNNPMAVAEAFARVGGMERVLARGATKVSLLSARGLQVDMRAVAPEQFGAALQYFTGSKAHNVKVREHAVRMGLKLSEYGLFRGEERIAGATEEEVYAALGMQTPPPTMRENRGEVELALRGGLPVVVSLEDMRGDLQSHSTYSDGRFSVREMAFAAAARGYAYYAVTDHGLRLAVTRSLSLEDIVRQREEIRGINEELAGRMTVLHGLEANIGMDGELDYPDEILAGFDLVVASLHHQLGGERQAMTRRVLRAIANPHVHVLGHPTGRMLPRRPASDLDLEAVCLAANEHGVALEINGSPRRLDLKDDHAFLARQLGCLFAISTDAHSVAELANMSLGVATAQRGWVQPAQVVNTWPLEELRRFLAKDLPDPGRGSGASVPPQR